MLLLAMLWPAVVAAWSQHWSPGIAAPDELSQVAWIANAAKGLMPQPRFTSGYLVWAYTAALGRWLPANATLVQLLPSLAVGLEGLLLAKVGGALGGPRAGLAAALVNAAAAQTLLRARTLLAFTYMPLELLLMVVLAEKLARPFWALAWGLLLSLILLDYEAWPVAWPGLLWLASRRRPAWGALLTGLGLGLTLVVLCTAPFWHNYAAQRSTLHTFDRMGVFLRFCRALAAYFGGLFGGCHELGAWPAFPLWALPLALLGLVRSRSQPWLWALVALGTLPMAAGDGAVEARRAVVAWPALCLLAGFGSAEAIGWSGQTRLGLGGLLKWSLPLALAGLMLMEAAAMHRALAARDQPTYALSRRAEAAAAVLEKVSPGPKDLLLELSGSDHAWEYWWLRSTPGAETWALVPGAYALPALRAQGGRWIGVGVPGAAPVFWLEPTAPQLARLRAVNTAATDLRAGLVRGVDYTGLLQRCMQRLPRAKDPWLRTLLLESALDCALRLGGPDESLLQALEAQDLCSSNAWLLAGAWLGPRDPARALRLLRRATSLDPRRAPAWRLRAALAKAQGLQGEAMACLARAGQAQDW
jgi:hypothetical protein